MISLIQRMLSLAALSVISANAQLNLLTGYPTPNVPVEADKYPSSLLVVDGLGHVTVAKELVSQSAGTFWIGVSYDARKAVFASGFSYAWMER